MQTRDVFFMKMSCFNNENESKQKENVATTNNIKEKSNLIKRQIQITALKIRIQLQEIGSDDEDNGNINN